MIAVGPIFLPRCFYLLLQVFHNSPWVFNPKVTPLPCSLIRKFFPAVFFRIVNFFGQTFHSRRTSPVQTTFSEDDKWIGRPAFTWSWLRRSQLLPWEAMPERDVCRLWMVCPPHTAHKGHNYLQIIRINCWNKLGLNYFFNFGRLSHLRTGGWNGEWWGEKKPVFKKEWAFLFFDWLPIINICVSRIGEDKNENWRCTPKFTSDLESLLRLIIDLSGVQLQPPPLPMMKSQHMKMWSQSLFPCRVTPNQAPKPYSPSPVYPFFLHFAEPLELQFFPVNSKIKLNRIKDSIISAHNI